MNNIAEDLKKYLDIDEEFVNIINNKIDSLNGELESISNERIEAEKNFEERLEIFKKQLEEEKELKFNDLKSKEDSVNLEKEKVLKIKTTEDTNKEDFKKLLGDTSAECDSKIASVNDAIKACGKNEALERALEEEKDKKEQVLNKLYEERKQVIEDIIETANLKNDKKEEPEISFDEDIPSFEEVTINNNFNVEEEKKEDNEFEIVSHESREDVVKDILGSKEIMEGHVFPFLKNN